MDIMEVVARMHDYLNGETTADTLPSTEQVNKAIQDYRLLREALEADQDWLRKLYTATNHYGHADIMIIKEALETRIAANDELLLASKN